MRIQELNRLPEIHEMVKNHHNFLSAAGVKAKILIFKYQQ